MIFTQLVDDDLGCASYLVGCEDAGVAAVVDPPYAIEPLLAEAERRGLRIVRAVETHTHADHVAGHGRLALEHGVPVSVHPAAEAAYPHDPFPDGDELVLGNVVLRCLHTPGHRPEHCCVAVVDRTRAEEPWLVLTGDSLFVGDAARPDLAVAPLDGAADLYRSLRRLLELPDGVEVFPGHVAGSLCGRSMGSRASTTIGFERRFNRALGFAAVEEFVLDAAAVAAPKPPNLKRIVELNRGPFLGAPPAVPELDAVPAGATILDVRPAAAFVAGHRPGALNVPVSGSSFATKAGFVLRAGDPLVVAAGDADEARRAVAGLRKIGFLELAGTIPADGPAQLRVATVEELDALAAAGAELLDVREHEERDTGYIPGSRNIPYRLLAAVNGELPEDRPIVTICETGPRAAIAASILARRGLDARPVLEGGVATWRARGGAVVEFRRCGSA